MPRAKFRPMRRQTAGPLVIDTGYDRAGEFFGIQADDHADVEVPENAPEAAICS